MIGFDKFCLKWLILPDSSLLVKIAYSAKNTAQTPLFCSNSAPYPKINFLIYFHK